MNAELQGLGRGEVENELEKAGVPHDANLIGMSPGSVWPTKRYPAERFAEVGRALVKKGYSLVMLGGPDDREACAEVAAEFCDLDLSEATLSIEGFGNVGRPAARFLAEKGVTLVAASDSRGAVHDPDGIDIEALVAAQARSQPFQLPSGIVGGQDLAEQPGKIPIILIARPDTITICR